MSKLHLKIPSLSERQNAYELLQNKQTHIDEQTVVDLSVWSRFDPRLGEILVHRLLDEWQNLNPVRLNQTALKSICPQAFAVIIEHLLMAIDDKRFTHYQKICTSGIEPAPYQAFTIGLLAPGGKRQRHAAEQPCATFSRWGFYESNLLFHKPNTLRKKTLLKISTRKIILEKLIREKKTFTVSDYITACEFRIHRRQAERDLANFFKLKSQGRTKGKVFQVPGDISGSRRSKSKRA